MHITGRAQEPEGSCNECNSYIKKDQVVTVVIDTKNKVYMVMHTACLVNNHVRESIKDLEK